MNSEPEVVLGAALELPEADRAMIAERLLATLSAEEGAVNDEEFEAELDRRFEEGRDDPSATIAWADLRGE